MKNLRVARVHFEVGKLQGRTLVACRKDDFIKTSRDIREVNCKHCQQMLRKND